VHSPRTLRVLRGSTDPGRARAAIAAVSSRVDDVRAVTVGARPEDDALELVAIEVVAFDGRSARAGEARDPRSSAAGSWTEDAFDLVLDDGSTIASMRSGAIGVVTVTVDPADEADAVALTARQQERLRHEGAVEALLVGRREVGPKVRIIAAALWRERDAAGAFLSSRPEGPGIDPRFQRLAMDLRFEMFDVVDPAAPVLPDDVPAVLVVDGDGVVVDASVGIERLAGTPPESLLGRRLASILRTPAGGASGSSPWDEVGDAIAAELVIEGRPVAVLAHSRAGIPAAGLTAILLESPSGGREDPERAMRRALGSSVEDAAADVPAAVWVVPRLTTIPSSDRLFGEFVERTVAALDLRSIRRLQLHLRGVYPRAVVHRRTLTGEGIETWYVFRDGRVASVDGEASWATEAGPAHATIGIDGTVTEADAEAGRVLGIDPRKAVGRDVRTLGVPGSFDDLDLLFRIVLELGAADSTIRILRPSGEPLDLAFRARVASDGIHCAFAEIPEEDDHPVWFAPLCLPTWDAAFVARVEELCARLAPREAHEIATELEVRLRVVYPLASVQPLGHVIGFGPRTEVLLVHRDGDPRAAEAWWVDPSVARLRVAGDRVEDLNDEAAVLLGTSRAAVLRSGLGRFASRRDHRVLFRDLLYRTGELHTTTWIETPDGPLEIEFRATVLEPHGPTVELAFRRAVTPRPDPPAGPRVRSADMQT
jgi:PAS domain-containing protein